MLSQQPMFKLCLAIGMLFIVMIKLRAQDDCQCNQTILVQVDAQCRYVLRKSDLGVKNCPNSYIAVQDNKAQNRDTIDAPGTYVYGLYQNDGRLICQGNVTAFSPSGPVLDSVRFSQDTLSFQALDQIFNKANTTGVPGSNLSLAGSSIPLTYDGRFVGLVQDKVANLGIPYFSMGCQTPRCGITLSFSDELVYSACRNAPVSNLYATIRRSWIARDCQARIKSSVQYIHFKNPGKQDFFWNLSQNPKREITLYYGDCSLNPNTQVLNQVFPVSTQQGLPVPISGLKISQAIQDIPDTTCAGKGIKITRNYFIYDECRNLIIDTFRVALAPGQAITSWIKTPVDSLVVGIKPENCQASLMLQTKTKLLDLFKAQVKFTCKEQFFDWVIERQVNQERDQWVRVAPPIQEALLLEPGYVRITLTALDSCQNLYTKRLYIWVKDSSDFNIPCPRPF